MGDASKVRNSDPHFSCPWQAMQEPGRFVARQRECGERHYGSHGSLDPTPTIAKDRGSLEVGFAVNLWRPFYKSLDVQVFADPRNR
jgi:hypothetical protein